MQRNVPSAVILGTKSRPEQIAMLGLIGGLDQFVMVPLDTTQDQRTYRRQALTVIRQRVAKWEGKVPFLGYYTGFVLNYDMRRAVVFDSDGSMTRILPEPFFYGRITIEVGHLLKNKER